MTNLGGSEAWSHTLPENVNGLATAYVDHSAWITSTGQRSVQIDGSCPELAAYVEASSYALAANRTSPNLAVPGQFPDTGAHVAVSDYDVSWIGDGTTDPTPGQCSAVQEALELLRNDHPSAGFTREQSVSESTSSPASTTAVSSSIIWSTMYTFAPIANVADRSVSQDSEAFYSPPQRHAQDLFWDRVTYSPPRGASGSSLPPGSPACTSANLPIANMAGGQTLPTWSYKNPDAPVRGGKTTYCNCSIGHTKRKRHHDTACPHNPHKKRFICPHCAEDFSRKDNLKRHIRRRH